MSSCHVQTTIRTVTKALDTFEKCMYLHIVGHWCQHCELRYVYPIQEATGKRLVCNQVRRFGEASPLHIFASAFSWELSVCTIIPGCSLPLWILLRSFTFGWSLITNPSPPYAAHLYKTELGNKLLIHKNLITLIAVRAVPWTCAEGTWIGPAVLSIC